MAVVASEPVRAVPTVSRADQAADGVGQGGERPAVSHRRGVGRHGERSRRDAGGRRGQRADDVIARIGAGQRQPTHNHPLAAPTFLSANKPTAPLVTRLTSSPVMTPERVAAEVSIVAEVVPS